MLLSGCDLGGVLEGLGVVLAGCVAEWEFGG